jgi:glycine/D-amino acid oxidase-like deaminating enzyme
MNGWTGVRDTDVLVIGGGLAGTGVAHHLARRGVEAMLVERLDINAQASGANSGSIHAQIPNEPSTTYGEDWTRTFAPTVKLMLRSIELWKTMGDELGVDLEVDTPGGLVCAFSGKDMTGLRLKLSIEKEQGLEGHLLDAADLRAVAPYVADDAVGGILYPVEGKANPLVAAPALAAAATRLGATILTRTGVTRLAPREGGGFDVLTTRGPIRARRVVNCAGAEAGSLARMVGLELPIEAFPIQTTVTEPTSPLVGHLLYAAGEKLSLKQNRRGQLLIGGGWDARLDGHGRPVADPDSLVGNMRVAVRVVPALAQVSILRTWAAIVNGTADWKPLLGETPRARGFFLCFFPWMGFSAGPVVSRAIGDLVLGRTPEVDLGPFLIGDR